MKFMKCLLLCGLFLLVSCQKDQSFDINKIADSDGLNGSSIVEIALIDTVKFYQLNKFEISFDDYKKINDNYFMRPEEINDQSAYQFAHPQMEYEQMLSRNFQGLSVRASRQYLEDIGFDLDELDGQIQSVGNPNYSVYVSQIFQGHENDESMLYVLHLVDNKIMNEYSDDENITSCHLYRYKFRLVNDEYKIFTKSWIFGFGLWPDELNEPNAIENNMKTLEERYAIEDYLMILDLNDLID